MSAAELDTPEQFTFERSFYIGSQITLVLYGIHIVMFFVSNHILLKSSGGWKETKFYIIYGSVMLTLWTIALACNAVFGQYIWIDHRDDLPGGPAEYLYAHIADWYNTWGTTAGIAMIFASDGLLIYRCFVIWGGSWSIVAFPILIYLGAMSMSILLIYESAQPGASFFEDRAVDFGVPYASLTVSLNIIVTLLIISRLLYLRKKVRTVLGDNYSKMYTSIAAIMAESAVPYTLLGIGYIITYARHTNVSFAFVQLWGDFAAISPQLIILRIALGHGWTKDTIDRVSTGLIFEGATGADAKEAESHGFSLGTSEGFSTTQYESAAIAKSRADSSIV